MDDPMKQAWNDVEKSFSTLGRMMKERYQGAGEGGTDDAPEDGTPDSGAALRQAFDRLVAAGREFGDRAADVARDDDVKAQARQAAAALNDALSATVDTIGAQIGGLLKRPHKGGSTPEITPPEPPTDDTTGLRDEG